MACILKGSIRGPERVEVIRGKDLPIAISWCCILLLLFQSFRTSTVSNKILIFFRAGYMFAVLTKSVKYLLEVELLGRSKRPFRNIS